MYRKKQQFKIVGGLMQATYPDESILDTQIAQTEAKLQKLQESRDLQKTVQPTKIQEPQTEEVQPDPPVLRFFAYRKERTTESQDETERVRFFSITFFVEDGTMMIEEKRQRNSGIDQGLIMKRSQVMDPNAAQYGTPYTLNSFRIGADLQICGCDYHIFDADGFTKEFIPDIGIPELPPEDLYSTKRQLTERPIRVTHINTDKTNLKNFLDYEGKVLRFYCIWDDREHLFGQKRVFIIHYFLVDGSIDVRHQLPPNAGPSEIHMFLSKTHLKNPETNADYTDADLRIGKTIYIFTRPFLIFDADEFTKEFIDKKFGKQDWTPLDVSDHYDDYTVKQSVPEYNGWGDEQDSLGYCYSLHPVPPKRNVIKLLQNEGKILRFGAKLHNSTHIDASREFVITYYLADDNLAVFEKTRRNSGFRGGKFIQKGLYKNGNRNFVASDFGVGKTVTINSYVFDIFEADEYAINYMEADADEFPESDLFTIVLKCKDSERIDSLRAALESLDQEHKGFVDSRAAQREISRAMGLTQQEALTIVRRWTTDQGFDYFQFITILS